MSDRPCGVTHTPQNNAYKLDELIDLALEQKLIKTKTQGKALKLKGLCDLLGLPLVPPALLARELSSPDGPSEKVKKEAKKSIQFCRSLTKDKILSEFAKELLELNVTESESKEMSKEDLCQVLYPTMKKDFDIAKCGSYTRQDILNYSRAYSAPLEDPSDKTKSCHLLDKAANNKYNSDIKSGWTFSDVDKCLISPTGMVKLGNQQVSAVKHLINHRSLLTVHDVGTGKTMIAVAAIHCVKARFPNIRIVILTPASLKSNFAANMAKYGVNRDVAEIYSYDEYLSFFSRASENPNCKNTFLIIDEAHNLRAPIQGSDNITKSKRAYAIMKCAAQAFRVLLMTATPFVNDYSDIINLKMMLDGEAPEPSNRISEKQLNQMIEDPATFLREWSCRVSYFMPPRQGDYPRPIYHPITFFEMDEKYYKQYKAVENKNADSGVLYTIGTLRNAGAFYSTLRRAVNALDGENNPKVRWVLDKIISDAKAGKKSVVYSNWLHAGINLLRRELDKQSDVKYGFITGEMTADEKDAFVKEYNENRAPILLITKAGAEGLNLLETHNVVLMESNWNASSDNQIIGRAVRLGSHSRLPPAERIVNVYRLMMRKPQDHQDDLQSVDEELYKIAYEVKLPKQQKVLRLLQSASIDSFECSCKREVDGSCRYDTSKFKPEKTKTVKVESAGDLFRYTAPAETSALVKPEKITAVAYEKLASKGEKEEKTLVVPPPPSLTEGVQFTGWDDLLDELEEEEEQSE